MTRPIIVTVNKRSDRDGWELRWRDPVTNRRCRRMAQSPTKSKATAEARELEKSLNSRNHACDGSIPWVDLISVYVDEHLSGLANASRQRSLSTAEAYFRLLNPERISDVTTRSLSRFVTDRRGEVEEPTIACDLRNLRALLRWSRGRYLDTLPEFPAVAKGAAKRKKGRSLTRSELLTLGRAVSSVVGKSAARSWRRFLVALLLSGFRLDELCRLRWDADPDSPEKTILVGWDAKKRPVFRIPAEGQKSRQEQVHPMLPHLARRINRIPSDKRVGLVFPVAKLRHRSIFTSQHASHVITAIGRASGVKVNNRGKCASAHDLRRTCSALLYSMGLSIHDVQLYLRHADISTTLNNYPPLSAGELGEKIWKEIK